MATKTKSKKSKKQFEGTVVAFCHTITFRYWDFKATLNPELEALLEEAAEERAREMIAQEFSSGELNCPYIDDRGREEEIRGWWGIE